jgi:ribosomal protein L11 methylase PrmA
MSKFESEFKQFYEDGFISELMKTEGTDSSLLSALQGQQDRWDDNDKLNLFKRVIVENSYLFKDKVVLDLRCGLGFYGIFAARAGASKVYSVDASPALALTKKIVERNNFQNIIEVLKGRINDLSIPEKSVDIIICDWVSSFIINDEIINDLILARNTLLKKGGLVR